ncbi:2,4-dichlorophenol 6-monooxygenase [archaeon BMS3Abin16]|nr:2,4-dichlorophenol 6-monooxygenase [archaeon BMS3Abin16]HDY73778.1 NAD(P)/FAD-dependent oxidoreductase [Euryarchaeota archaeon]
MNYDVIIIGGGPCGLIAARDIAGQGAEVCVIEKSPEIGYPVKCSGLFSTAGLKQIGVDVSDSLICSTIRGGRFYSPGGEDFLAYSKQDRAVVVERKMFDKELARDAVRAGAKIRLKTTALDIKRNGRVSVRINEVGEEKTISSKLLIGADGAGSQVARWAGIERENKFVSGVQVEVAAADVESDVAEVYFGKSFAPGFYAWILPKGDVFEVGIGSTGGGGETPRELLKRFMAEHPIASKKLDSKSILEFNKGAIPVGGPRDTVSENIMLIGDAAGQTKASTGGGVITGGICARIAADAAISAIEEDNYSQEFLLTSYDQKWRAELEQEFMAHLFMKNIIDSATDPEIDSLFNMLKKEGVPELMTTFTDTDRPLEFIKEVLKKEEILNWAQRFLDIRKELLG